MDTALAKMTKAELLEKIDHKSIPRHVGIIMDGNGRWAKGRGLFVKDGHRRGAEALRRVLIQAEEIGVGIITSYAFSTENWKRSPDEVSFIMNLMIEYLKKEVKALHKRNVKIVLMGDMEGLPKALAEEFLKAEQLTADNQKLILNAAVNYGSRTEITRAVKAIGEKVAKGELDPALIDEELIGRHLYTAGQADPDLLIRPSGEERLSNFMLWQGAYSELYFTSVLWPDFDGAELLRAIYVYQQRCRRFGGRNS